MDISAKSAKTNSLILKEKVKITFFAFRVLKKAGCLFQQPANDFVHLIDQYTQQTFHAFAQLDVQLEIIFMNLCLRLFGGKTGTGTLPCSLKGQWSPPAGMPYSTQRITGAACYLLNRLQGHLAPASPATTIPRKTGSTPGGPVRNSLPRASL
ncbi:hypothetical protein [uncultured Microbulbifer sp.]|uniref:hypothetical protein n=1 Tax=uncultured Microbulbifer sp. TaxID=348147 RepID=UPI00260ABE51|nr:hypothetical protein [uncultured Microbulbifer sp.]